VTYFYNKGRSHNFLPLTTISAIFLTSMCHRFLSCLSTTLISNVLLFLACLVLWSRPIAWSVLNFWKF